jgi:hypothetical protein
LDPVFPRTNPTKKIPDIMNGDFSRFTFDPSKHFAQVLMQQGRVLLDADFNEQSSILLHYLRTLARDLIGPYAAPVEHPGFSLQLDDNAGFKIGAGRYYVDGILVENESECTYKKQPDYSAADKDPFLQRSKTDIFWAYLDVWERHITALEDDSILEKALGGPDTCTRSKVVWQVKVRKFVPLKGSSNVAIEELQAALFQLQHDQNNAADPGTKMEIGKKIAYIEQQLALVKGETGLRCDEPLTQLIRPNKPKLAARVDPGQKDDNPCITPPDSKYRGPENCLYRVEIHAPGKVGQATFKWARDNSSNATAWLNTSGNEIEVATTRGFKDGGWLELSDDSLDLAGLPGVLGRIAKVEAGRISVDPDSVPKTGTPLAWSAQRPFPKVRHWNQAQRGDIKLKDDGAVDFQEASKTADGWIDLEDGVQIRFHAGGEYLTGDYWLIPARVATGKLEWPIEDGKEKWLPPMGIEHHYAPLGFISWGTSDSSGKEAQWQITSCACEFAPLSSCFRRFQWGVAASDASSVGTVGAIKPVPAPQQQKRVKSSPKKPTPP